MPIPSVITDLSTNPISNSPLGSEIIGTNLDNYLRSMQAITRSESLDKEWSPQVYTHTYQTSTTFTINGLNVTSAYVPKRRIRAVGATTGTIYGTITASTFGINTLVTVLWDSGALQNETLIVSLGTHVNNFSLPTTVISDAILGNPVIGDIIYRGASQWQRLPVGSASQTLMSNSTSTAPVWRNLVISNIKLANEARAVSATFVIDSNLVLPIVAGTRYKVVLEAMVSTNAVATGTPILYVGDITPANSTTTGIMSSDNTTSSIIISAPSSANPLTTVGVISTNYYVRAEVIVSNVLANSTYGLFWRNGGIGASTVSMIAQSMIYSIII